MIMPILKSIKVISQMKNYSLGVEHNNVSFTRQLYRNLPKFYRDSNLNIKLFFRF